MDSTSGIFLSLAYYVVFAVIAIAPYLLLRRNWTSIDPFEPYFGLSIILFAYTASALVAFSVSGLSDDVEAVSPYSVSKFALACLLGQAGLACGELAGASLGRTGNRTRLEDAQRCESILTGPALILALLLIPFYLERFNFLNVASYAETALESRIVRFEDLNAGVKDIFLRDIPTTIVLCASTVLLFDSRRLMPVRVIAGFVIAAHALTGLLGGARGLLASTALLPLLYYHYRVRRLGMPIVLSLGVITYIAYNLLSVARLSSDLFEMMDLVAEKVSTEGFGFLELGQSSELRTSVNLVRLIVGLDTGEETLRLGGVTWGNVVSSIPRSLWPHRPLTGAELFTEVFYPGALGAGAGYGAFIFQDPYWDFGFAGVFVMSALYGWGMRWLYTSLVVYRSSGFWTLVYALAYGHVAIFSVRSGLFAGLKNSLIAVAPLLVIAFLAAPSGQPNPAPKAEKQ